MSRFRTASSRLVIVSGLTVAVISGSTALAHTQSNWNNADCRSNATTHQQQEFFKDRPSTMSGWDSDWDCRQPVWGEKTNEDDNSEVAVKPTATRHVILVRHGQYVKSSDPSKKILTNIGRYTYFFGIKIFFFFELLLYERHRFKILESCRAIRSSRFQ